MIESGTDFKEYILIDWAKPPPIIQPKPVRLTSVERSTINRGFALNQATKRYIEKDKYHEYTNLFKGQFSSTSSAPTGD